MRGHQSLPKCCSTGTSALFLGLHHNLALGEERRLSLALPKVAQRHLLELLDIDFLQKIKEPAELNTGGLLKLLCNSRLVSFR